MGASDAAFYTWKICIPLTYVTYNKLQIYMFIHTHTRITESVFFLFLEMTRAYHITSDQLPFSFHTFPKNTCPFYMCRSKINVCLKSVACGAEDVARRNSSSSSVYYGGFVVPVNNSYGNSFRDYDADSERRETVEELYRLSHINQTYDFVKRMRETYSSFDRVEMSIWECCELLNEVVDESDPDLDEPQIQHLLQSAEAIRKDYPNQDWLHLTALIHDLGKVLLLPSFGGLPQWAVVGDTFPLGCAFDQTIVHYEHFKGNPDNKNPAYNTKFGVYAESCGLDNVFMSWGHDDYMYLVAKENKTTLPSAALFIIRYHSFYALHKSGAYRQLMNEEDVENLKWLHIFNKYDLYSKSKMKIDVDKVKPYYISLIDKYFPAKLKW